MKKILRLLNAVVLTSTLSTSVVACLSKTNLVPTPTSKINLNTVTTINPPNKIWANNPSTTTKTELLTALNPKVQAAIATIITGIIKENDYIWCN